jgi:hypothetical protein
MTLGVDCAIDMVEEAKLPEHGVEEGTPCREGVAVVKLDPHMRADVHMLESSDGDRNDRGVGKGVGGGGNQ